MNNNQIEFQGAFGLRGETLEVLIPPQSSFSNLFSLNADIDKEQGIELLKLLSKKYFESFFAPSSEEIIFFGGTFDPWHSGHLACLELLGKESLKKVLIIPDKNPKKTHQRNSLNPWQHYQNLLEKTKFLEPPPPIFPGFLTLPDLSSNPTSSWASTLRRPFSFLMGDDSFISLPYWIKPELFLPKTRHIYLVSREEKEFEIEKVREYLVQVAPSLKIIELGKHPFQHLSSTKLRSMKK